MKVTIKVCIICLVTMTTQIGLALTRTQTGCFDLPLTLEDGDNITNYIYHYERVPEKLSVNLTCDVANDTMRITKVTYLIPDSSEHNIFCKGFDFESDSSTPTTDCCKKPDPVSLCKASLQQFYRQDSPSLGVDWSKACVNETGSCFLEGVRRMAFNKKNCKELEHHECMSNDSCYSRWVDVEYTCTTDVDLTETDFPTTDNLPTTDFATTQKPFNDVDMTEPDVLEFLTTGITLNGVLEDIHPETSQKGEPSTKSGSLLVYVLVPLFLVVLVILVVAVICGVKNRKKKKNAYDCENQSIEVVVKNEDDSASQHSLLRNNSGLEDSDHIPLKKKSSTSRPNYAQVVKNKGGVIQNANSNQGFSVTEDCALANGDGGMVENTYYESANIGRTNNGITADDAVTEATVENSNKSSNLEKNREIPQTFDDGMVENTYYESAGVINNMPKGNGNMANEPIKSDEDNVSNGVTNMGIENNDNGMVENTYYESAGVIKNMTTGNEQTQNDPILGTIHEEKLENELTNTGFENNDGGMVENTYYESAEVQANKPIRDNVNNDDHENGDGFTVESADIVNV